MSTATTSAHPPEVSVQLYREATELAAASPPWLQQLVEVGTEAGLGVFAVFFLAAWWRSRPLSDRTQALALLAPVATVVAYLASEAVKLVVREDRPCRTVPGVRPIAACPGVGDWSLPSNHAAIAGAAVATVAFAWRVLAVAVLPAALLLASSRVFVGVHYPHDVVVGLLVGAAVAGLAVAALAWPAARTVTRLRGYRLTRPLVASARVSQVRSPT